MVDEHLKDISIVARDTMFDVVELLDKGETEKAKKQVVMMLSIFDTLVWLVNREQEELSKAMELLKK